MVERKRIISGRTTRRDEPYLFVPGNKIFYHNDRNGPNELLNGLGRRLKGVVMGYVKEGQQIATINVPLKLPLSIPIPYTGRTFSIPLSSQTATLTIRARVDRISQRRR